MKSKLKFEGTNFHQGDSQFFKLEALPKGLKKIEKRYIAASERSGSFHALFGKYDMYELEDGGVVVDVQEECILNHSLKEVLQGTGVTLSDATVLQKKDHRHTVIAPGVYYVDIQQRFDPLANAKKRVID
jgi:hypothetical protein